MNESDNSSSLFPNAQSVETTDTSIDSSQFDIFYPIPYNRVEADDAAYLTDITEVDTNE
jgi:hypothetical protein